MSEMPRLKIGDLEARIPIIQGGMGVGVSLSGLASAVANEGAIGIISSAGIGMLESDFAKNFREANARSLRKEIRKAKEMSKDIIGVNIMVALSDYDDHVNVAVEEGVDLIIAGAGLPLKIPEKILQDKIGKNSTKFVPIVSSGRAAELIFRYWAKHYDLIPDAVVVEGPLAGGHLGFKKERIDDPDYALEKIIPDVISVMKIYEQRYGKNIPVIIPEWGRTLLPIRSVIESLGGSISWDGTDKKVTINISGTKIELWIDKNYAYVNGKKVQIDSSNSNVKPIIMNSRTMLPIRFVAESIGAYVGWYPADKGVLIVYPKE